MAEAKALTDDAEQLAAQAAEVLRRVSDRGLSLATAESCTGGLLASLLTDIEGLSGCFERGFTVYSEESKCELLDVDARQIERHGAVSREVALAMGRGALANSRADLTVAITGFAGPAGDGDEEGLVHLAVHSANGGTIHRECHFGSGGRDRTRLLAARTALEMLDEALTMEEMGEMKERLKGPRPGGRQGQAKRAIGELTGRPDIVLDGEEQQALGHREQRDAERKAARDRPITKE